MTTATSESVSRGNDEAWTHLQISSEREGKCTIKVSNPSFPIPDGLDLVPDFVTKQEATCIIEEADERKWQWGGFSHKRRFQRYNLADESKELLPPSLEPVVDRLVSTIGRIPQHVIIEEYPCNVGQIPTTSTYRVTTSFESFAPCNEDSTSRCDCCFVAQVALRDPAVQHLNRPKRRDVECWTLVSDDHWTDLVMEPHMLVVKSADCLWDWRSRVAPMPDSNATDRAVIVKFYSLPNEPNESKEEEAEITSLNDPSIEILRPVAPMPPLHEILTIIVTTSPILSNPSTELLETTFDSFRFAGDDFCYKCRKVIVCDGCRVLDESDSDNRVSRKHSSATQALRNGIATTAQVDLYKQFKENLRRLCETAASDSPFHTASVEELQERHGYGFALRHALQHCVATPYVCVIQHDRTFMRPTPLRETVHAMWNNSGVKYVGMSMRSNLTYRDIFLSKYGKESYDDMSRLVLRPPELELNASIYGPEGSSCRQLVCLSENVLMSTTLLAQNYMRSLQCLGQQEWLKSHPPAPGRHQLTLTPTLFWYDNTHIVDTAHYRDFILHPKYQLVARGGFVEDKLSPSIAKSVDRLGLAKGHARYGCFLLDDHCGYFFTGHLDGGHFMTRKQREDKFAKYANNNIK